MKKVFAIVMLTFTSMVSLYSCPFSHILSIHGYCEIKRQDSDRDSQFLVMDTLSLPIMPPSNGVQFYRTWILYLGSSKDEQKIIETHLSFGKAIPMLISDEDSISGSWLPFFPSSKITFPVEATSFSPDYNTMYFTWKNGKKGSEKIYKASYSGTNENKPDWSIESLPVGFCSDNSRYMHPTLSADGSFMIFASNRQGSKGGMDLFISRLEKGEWSNPEPLSDNINTMGNEIYPYLDAQNNLYFSSDGQPGKGGYDVFLCIFSGKKWGDPINLNAINSENDELAYRQERQTGRLAIFTRQERQEMKKSCLVRIRIAKPVIENNPAQLANIFANDVIINPQTGKIEIKADREDIIKEEKNKSNNQMLQAKNKSGQKDQDKLKKDQGKQMEKTNPAPTKENPIQEKVQPEKLHVVTKQDSAKKSIQKTTVDNPIVYRVQIITSSTPNSKKEVTIGTKTYPTFEYQYKGAYRITIGSFATYKDAMGLQGEARKSGFNQAFIVALKGKVRITDPSLFK